MSARDVVITGLGLVSCLGEGPEAHWSRLSAGGVVPPVENDRFAPYPVHPLPEIDWGLQIAKRGDQRQMEAWQRLGTYAAGLALDDAGMKGDEALCSTMDMIVAASGGERDEAVDTGILAASETRADTALLLNERLTTELRPTLFLAQLSNLLAGNISIVHKVTGSSRTFMGEEGSAIAALESAAARIRAGRSTHALIGGALNAEHPDTLLGYELGGYLHRDAWAPVWQRGSAQGGGVIPGSGAAFLVLESREHAEKRGHRIYAALGPVISGRARRAKEELDGEIGRMLAGANLPSGPLLAISSASGAHQATSAEASALKALGNIVPRGLSSLTGHTKEAGFPFAIALAALAVHRKAAYAPFDPAEAPFDSAPKAVLATGIGYHRSEGLALVVAA